ncbi:MAG: ABC transporter ATP-binding protein [Faecalibacterium sp.]
MICVNGVTKHFDDFLALDNLTLTVPKGCVYGLVGPNGAGKSTILRHILGCYRPDEGQVSVAGAPVYENVAVKEKIASIPDDFYYPLSASLKDMKAYYKMFYPHFSDARYEILRDAFPAIDEKRPLRKLSKGMQKQAAFWLALCCEPELLVLDEPVDGLDPVMRRQVWSLLLSDCAERGTTVLVSSHNLRELEDVCDHVGILDKGKLLLERRLSDLQDNLVKIQVAYAGGTLPTLPEVFEVLHQSAQGKVHTLIIRGQAEAVSAVFEAHDPLLLDSLPLTLEEIFIYELGGHDYAVKEILL